MKTITIRGVDDHLAEKLKQSARKEAKSVNQFVVDALRGVLGLNKEKMHSSVYDDMDHLFGKWSQEEFDLIQRKINTERRIDRELWE